MNWSVLCDYCFFLFMCYQLGAYVGYALYHKVENERMTRFDKIFEFSFAFFLVIYFVLNFGFRIW